MLIQHLPRTELSRKIQSALFGSIILKNQMMWMVKHVGEKGSSGLPTYQYREHESKDKPRSRSMKR